MPVGGGRGVLKRVRLRFSRLRLKSWCVSVCTSVFVMVKQYKSTNAAVHKESALEIQLAAFKELVRQFLYFCICNGEAVQEYKCCRA